MVLSELENIFKKKKKKKSQLKHSKHNNIVGCESMADLGECTAVVLPGRSFSSTVLLVDLRM